LNLLFTWAALEHRKIQASLSGGFREVGFLTILNGCLKEGAQAGVPVPLEAMRGAVDERNFSDIGSNGSGDRWRGVAWTGVEPVA